ncbi:MAG: transcription factor S [Thermoprotei archaeon]|nr:transcription factor S [TACK group archaeon]
MKFCPKDGSLMQIKRQGPRTVWYCPTCGYTEDVEPADQTHERVTVKRGQKLKEINENEAKNLPKVRVTCPKCGKEVEAYYWMEQTRAGDEPMTRFFKCTVCGYVWREYS